MAVENITLNLIPTGDTPSIHAAQYDVERPFTVTLKEGADDFTPTGYDIELQVRKVDNNIVTAIPTSTIGNVVTFNTTEQMTACSGTNLAELQLSKDAQTIATLHFYLVVQRDVLAGGLTSQSEIYDLEEQIAAIVPEVIGDEYYTAEEVDEKIAEIPTFDPTNYYTKSQLYTQTETNGLLSQKVSTSALSTVAFTGSYNNLIDTPNIPDVSDYYTKSETYSQNEVNTLLGTKADTSSLSTVATTGDYDDLLDKPTIPTNAELLPIESGSATNTKDYIDNKQDKYWKKLSSAFELTGNATGTWSFTDDLSTSKYTDIMFCISLVSNDGGVRSSMSLSRLGFEAYGVFYDYTIGTDRMYFQLSKATNNSFTISGTNLGGISSRVFVTAYYR